MSVAGREVIDGVGEDLGDLASRLLELDLSFIVRETEENAVPESSSLPRRPAREG